MARRARAMAAVMTCRASLTCISIKKRINMYQAGKYLERYEASQMKSIGAAKRGKWREVVKKEAFNEGLLHALAAMAYWRRLVYEGASPLEMPSDIIFISNRAMRFAAQSNKPAFVKVKREGKVFYIIVVAKKVFKNKNQRRHLVI